MIIKSMSGKKPDFRRLVEYISREAKVAGDYVVVQNLYADGSDPEVIIEQFQTNSQYLPKRKNGNFLYHEIISLEENTHIKSKDQEKVLMDLVDQYLVKRAPRQLVYGRMHHDSDNLHFHLLMSSNQARSRQRVRLAKKDFVDIEKSIEDYKLEKYPKLDQTRLHTKGKEGRASNTRSKQREYDLTKRTKKPSQKERVRGVLIPIFNQAKSSRQLQTLLAEKDLKIYQRGKNWGIRDVNTGSKSRFKTLGINEKFVQMCERIEKLEERSLELSWRWEQQAREKGLDHNR